MPLFQIGHLLIFFFIYDFKLLKMNALDCWNFTLLIRKPCWEEERNHTLSPHLTPPIIYPTFSPRCMFILTGLQLHSVSCSRNGYNTHSLCQAKLCIIILHS